MEQNKDQSSAAVRGAVRSGCPCDPLGLEGVVCPDPKTGLPLCSSADCYSAKPVAAVRGEAVALTDTEIMEALSEVQFPTPVRLPAGWVYFARAIEKKIAAKVSARAADALDSQPTERPIPWEQRIPAHVRQIGTACSEIDYVKAELAEWRASSQPTDGGVRNGRAELAKLLAGAEPGDAT